MVEARQSELSDEEVHAICALVRGKGGWKHAGAALGLSGRAVDNAVRGRARAGTLETLRAGIRRILRESPQDFVWRTGDTWAISALLVDDARGVA